MEVKRVLAQEGRDAKNILLYHLPSDGDNGLQPKSNIRKPPILKANIQKSMQCEPSGPRVRSASTGRDKRSELQARYWALLFGNLQRVINEIYQTVECYENLPSCQEVILVLENYTRDFRALAEWFKVSWDYETTPQPQRPQSLAWEVRKSNPAPKLRAKSLSSPSPVLSGKSSPCPSYSGKSSPCSTGEEYKFTSPRRKVFDQPSASNKIPPPDKIKSPRMNIRDIFFVKSQGSASESIESSGPQTAKDMELTNIPEEAQTVNWNEMVLSEEARLKDATGPTIQTNTTANTSKWREQYSQTHGFEDETLTLQQWRFKYNISDYFTNAYNLNAAKLNANTNTDVISSGTLDMSAIDFTTSKLNEMENAFLITNNGFEQNRENTEDTEEKKIFCRTESALPAQLEKLTVDKTTNENKISGPPTSRKNTENVAGDDKKSSVAPLKYSNVLNRPAPFRSGSGIKPSNPKIPSTKASSANSKASVSNTSVGISQLKKLPIRTTTSKPPSNAASNVKNSKPNGSVPPKCINGLDHTFNHSVPSNVSRRLATRSKTMGDMALKRNSACKLSSNTLSSSTLSSSTLSSSTLNSEKLNSSTSTLKASNEHITPSGSNSNLNSSQSRIRTRKSEPRSMSKYHEDDDDGWLTVKARRRNSLHWANRFNQPTGYTSLPTLALLNIEEDNTDVKNVNKKDLKKPIKPSTNGKSPKLDLSKPKMITAASKSRNSTTTHNEFKVLSKVQQTVPVQELRSKPLKHTDVKVATDVRRPITFVRPKSGLTGLKLTSLHKEYLKKEKSIRMADANSLNTAKKAISISSVMQDLYRSCLDAKNTSQRSPTDDKFDTEDDKDDIESDEHQRQLLEEQECLERQILELQNTEIDVDTETDDPDAEVVLDLDATDISYKDHASEEDDDNMSIEARYHALLSDMSSGERIQTLATLEALHQRHPGRAQELHQKLSSPSRRRSLHENLKKYQAKQARAQDMRDTLNKEKALKIQQLLARVEDVKSAKQQLIDDKRMRMEEKLQRYAENRTQYIKDKIRKAHDEEEKLKEIAFIKSLEAQNKRLDFIELKREQEGRLQDLEQERQKRAEEKAAKEAAVERRRQELAMERQKRLEKMDETRREREQRVEQMQEEKEKMRQKIAREKARDREERLLALQVQQQQTTEELQRKIIQKQQESARRHEENIEHIRQRALELSIPTRNVDENGVRTESNDRGDEDLSSVVSDMSIGHTKSSKKKLKKLRLKLTEKAEEYATSLDQVPNYMRRDSEVPKLLGIIRKGGGPQGVERPLGQLLRLTSKPSVFDYQCLWLMNGLGVFADVIKGTIESDSKVSQKAVILAIEVYRDSCSCCPQIARHAILGNSIVTLFDVLLHSLKTPHDKTLSHPIELSTELVLACTVVISMANTLKQAHPKVLERLPDLISYAVSIGLIDVLARRCMKIREPIENHQSVVLSVLSCLCLLTKFADICPKGSDCTTKFLAVVKSTELFGTISLLNATVVPVGEAIPPRTISLAAASFNLILTVANLDINMFQSILSQQCLSLQFLDVVTILLKYCGPQSIEKGETQAVIIDLVATLGFFCSNNENNQNLITSDQSLVLIKSLSKLPKTFDIVVYPTLVTIINNNDGAKSVIGREFDVEEIEEFRATESAQKNKMLAILQGIPKP